MIQKVRVTVTEGYPYATVYGYLYATLPAENPDFSEREFGATVTLYVDTLATHTTLGPGTAEMFDLPLEELELTTTQTFLGPLDVRVLEDVRLHVESLDGNQIPLTLKQVHVMDPDHMMVDLSDEELQNIPDILGTDIIRRGGIQIDWRGGDSCLALEVTQEGEVLYLDDPTRAEATPQRADGS